jgi:hypothetical protein
VGDTKANYARLPNRSALQSRPDLPLTRTFDTYCRTAPSQSMNMLTTGLNMCPDVHHQTPGLERVAYLASC